MQPPSPPPPRTLCTLNDDILRHIVAYIPPKALDRVNSANPVFFEEWMKSRYVDLSVRKRDRFMKNLLLHLSDRNVAHFVKRVNIQPWLVQPHTKSPRSLTENVIIRFSEVIDPDYTKKVAEQRLRKRLAKDMKRVISAFQEMKNVQEYEIDWDETIGYHPELYTAFLTPVLEMWATQLVRLTIKIPLPMLNSLARVRLPNLESFHYTFSTGVHTSQDIENAHDGFVVFVNNLKDSLCSLSFRSTTTSYHLDLGRIFRLLGTFPKLSGISVSIPFDGAHFADPMLFVRFVNKHRQTLKEFNLCTNGITIRKEASHPDCTEWIQRIIASIDTPFPLLRSFGIALRPVRAPLDPIARFLDMHTSTLNTVMLMDRAMEPHELGSLFATPDSGRLLARSLVRLDIKVDTLSPYMLLSMADLFPNLQALRIECTQVEVNHGKGFMPEFSAYLKQHDIKERLNSWRLQHLTLGLPSHRFGWMSMIEKDLREYFPNLTIS